MNSPAGINAIEFLSIDIGLVFLEPIAARIFCFGYVFVPGNKDLDLGFIVSPEFFNGKTSLGRENGELGSLLGPT
jgi:hypothetical protein